MACKGLQNPALSVENTLESRSSTGSYNTENARLQRVRPLLLLLLLMMMMMMMLLVVVVVVVVVMVLVLVNCWILRYHVFRIDPSDGTSGSNLDIESSRVFGKPEIPPCTAFLCRGSILSGMVLGGGSGPPQIIFPYLVGAGRPCSFESKHMVLTFESRRASPRSVVSLSAGDLFMNFVNLQGLVIAPRHGRLALNLRPTANVSGIL